MGMLVRSTCCWRCSKVGAIARMGNRAMGLAIRQAYLAEVDAEDASLAGAHLSEAVLAEAFNFPICVALSGDGASLVTGTSAGEVWLWRVADRTPQMAIQMRSGPG